MTSLLFLLGSLLLVFYAHVGYPMLMALLARWRPRAVKADDSSGGGLSIVLCVHNAESLVADRLHNLLACKWLGPLEIVVYGDGCTDQTMKIAGSIAPHVVRVIDCPTQSGKASALNAAIPACSHPIVVLCDVRQTFHEDALVKLTAPFADQDVQAVSGLLEIAESASGGGRGVDLYWKLEKKLREWEGRYDSVIGCTGAICAIRRDGFLPLDEDTILDDVVIPMRLAVAGGRILYEPSAIAYDPQQLNPEKEKRRKLRTLVGNYQMIERYPRWLLPWENRLWWQLISHKYLRLAVPWLLVLIAALSLVELGTPAVAALAVAQLFAYGAAVVGLVVPGWRRKVFTIPAGFVLLQWACAQSLIAYLSHRKELRVLWR